jgi:hypothetical protein
MFTKNAKVRFFAHPIVKFTMAQLGQALETVVIANLPIKIMSHNDFTYESIIHNVFGYRSFVHSKFACEKIFFITNLPTKLWLIVNLPIS